MPIVYFTLLATLAVFTAVHAETTTKTFNVNAGGWLVVETDMGPIEVESADVSTVSIEVENAEKLELTFGQEGNDVHIKGEKPEDAGFSLFRKFKPNWKNPPRFHIVVPQRYNVDLKTAGGGIAVDDLKGEVRVRTSGGSLKFGRIHGPIQGDTSGGGIAIEEVEGETRVHTSGGSIEIVRAKGDVDAKTSGGNIRVEEIMGALNAHTSGGSIKAYISEQPYTPCTLKTSGGSVNIYLAEHIAANVDARTSGGNVKTDFPVVVQGELKKNHLKAQLNGGGPKLNLRTSGGNIRLHKM